jgi:hypothetical protein
MMCYMNLEMTMSNDWDQQIRVTWLMGAPERYPNDMQ